jgi:hypothetical protein
MFKDNNIIPDVNPGDWILIGADCTKINAVVCAIYKENPLGTDLEVVYLSRNKAINDGVVWKKDHWEFLSAGPSGGYADRNSKLNEFVTILRNGKHLH